MGTCVGRSRRCDRTPGRVREASDSLLKEARDAAAAAAERGRCSEDSLPVLVNYDEVTGTAFPQFAALRPVVAARGARDARDATATLPGGTGEG